MRPVRASEIGSYIFCQRAWWYSQRGVVPLSTQSLERGSSFHMKNWRITILSRLLRILAFVVLILGFSFIVVQFFVK